MPVEMQGRRIPLLPDGADPYSVITEAGDYYGPDNGEYSGGVPAVHFLLPIARDPDAQGSARALHHVCSPPHTFKEEADGTLTIRNSIGAGPSGNYYWHGFLTHGRWERECRD